MPKLPLCCVRMEVLGLLSCTCTVQRVLPEVTPASPFSQGPKMGRKILHPFVVTGGRGVPTIWALWGSMPQSNRGFPSL